MRIVILGGAGFLGKKLALKLLQLERLSLNGQPAEAISELVLFDKVGAEGIPADERLHILEGDINETKDIQSLLASPTQVIFHLAAIVSGEAEKNFELGMQVNLQANLHILECCRIMRDKPLLVFASSCAVFGGDLTDTIFDNTAPAPQSSYGTQKAVMDLLINDYHRRGFINGRALRLPTIAIRPGKANAATSSFVSAIIREPLTGKSTNCPVSKDTKVWILSPRKVIENFVHAAQLPAESLQKNCTINLPGLTTSVGEIVQCLESIADQETSQLITWQPDTFIQSIVLTWPPQFQTSRGLALGFKADQNMEEIIHSFIEEELT